MKIRNTKKRNLIDKDQQRRPIVASNLGEIVFLLSLKVKFHVSPQLTKIISTDL